ncbi:unnamed protein product [Paramecium primaurelia]|uniref:Uncharacterized protein n=1 Tax=Paramecium primaurelia TaxID=5886 RepID=A0A8S1M0Y9_PARPR|nr:unnamed protein product [Paramecium primaurelia]
MQLYQQKNKYFIDMIKFVKNSSSNNVLCKWGFDNETNLLLLLNDLPAISWISSTDVELIAIVNGVRTIQRFLDITPANLEKLGLIKEVQFETSNERMLVMPKLNYQR